MVPVTLLQRFPLHEHATPPFPAICPRAIACGLSSTHQEHAPPAADISALRVDNTRLYRRSFCHNFPDRRRFPERPFNKRYGIAPTVFSFRKGDKKYLAGGVNIE